MTSCTNFFIYDENFLIYRGIGLEKILALCQELHCQIWIIQKFMAHSTVLQYINEKMLALGGFWLKLINSLAILPQIGGASPPEMQRRI